MGSFNGTCHLSGMGISRGESVIFVPVRYSHLTETTTQVYSTRQCAHIAEFPLTAHYNYYGSIEKIVNEWLLGSFRFNLNRGLFNNKAFENMKGWFLGKRYALFKRDNFPTQYENLGFLSDRDINKKLSNREGLHDIQKIEKNEDIVGLLSNNHLISFSAGVIYRYGHILIKTSFLNKLIESSYKEQMERIKRNIREHIITPLEDDEIIKGKFFHGNNISKDSFERKALELFNDNNTFSHDQYNVLKLIREKYFLSEDKNNEELSQFVDTVTQQAIISIIYADLGKTFYPNAMLLKSHKSLYNYASLLKSELEELNRKNLKEYSPENGYDEETQQRNQWQTPF